MQTAKFIHKLMGLVLLLFMFMAASVYAGGGIEWTNINDGLPNDISISDLAVDPDNSSIIYAAVGSGGVYKTTNSGDNWIDITNGLDISSTKRYNGQGGYAMAVDSNNIYLGCSGRIFKCATNSTNWVDITGTMTISPWAALSIVVQSDGIYVGNDSGVYKSTNTGTSWVRMNSLSNCKVVTGTTTGNLYAFNYSGLLVTTDGGQSWGTVSSLSFSDLLVYQDAMYATTYNNILRSTNNGSTWGTITTGLPSQGISSSIVLAGHPATSSTLYARMRAHSSKGSALYKTTNGGGTWGTVTALSPSAQAQKILVTTNAVYVAGKGIHRSMNGGDNWTTINTGLPHLVDVSTIAVDPKATGTVYTTNNRGIFKSIDAGNSWSEKNSGLPITYSPNRWDGFCALIIDPNDSNTIYAGGNQMLYKSTNGGDNWGSITAGLSGGYVYINSIAIDPNNSQTIYIPAGWEAMYKSIDAGTTWSKITIPQGNINNLFIAPEDSSLLTYGNVWATNNNYNGNIYRSNNHGGSWTTIPVSSNLLLQGITLGTTASTIYAYGNLGYYQYTLGKILKTTNSGGTWTQISDEKVNSLIVNPDITGVLYAQGNDGVVKSIDDGKSWGETNHGLPINTGKLISATYGSVGSVTFVMDPAMHNRFYLNCPPYGIYRGTDTNASPMPPTIHTPADGAKTSDQTPLVIGNSSPGSVVFVYDGTSTLMGTATTDSSGLFSLTSNNLNIGTHTINAIAVDRFGTSGTTSLSIIIVQGIAPTIDNPISSATNQATITITGIAENGATVVIYDNLIPIATVTSNGFYSHTITFDEGLHKLFVQSTNNNGVTAASNMVDLLIDTKAPQPPIITKPTNNSKIPADKLTISGYALGSSTVFIYLNSQEEGTCTSDANGNFSFTTTQAMDGVYEITVRVKNAVNTISPPSYPIKVTVGIPPIITNPVSGKTSKTTNLTISGNCNIGVDVGIYLDNVNIGTTTAPNGTFSYNLTTLTPGTHTVTAIAVKGTKHGSSNVVTLIISPDLPIDPIGVNISSPRGTEHPMSMDEDSKVGVHWQSLITISVPVVGSPTHVYLRYKGTDSIISNHSMTDDDNDGVYEYSFRPYPLHGDVPLDVIIEYGTVSIAPINIGSILIDPDGHVYNSVTKDKVTDAVVTCYYLSTTTTTWVVWDAWNYPFNNVPQINPQTTTTTNDCYYSFIVPAGKYYVQAVCPGYNLYQSGVLEVINDPVHHDVYMEPIPVLTSMKVSPQAVVFSPGGTYSFTATNCRDQYDRAMNDAACNWSCSTGSFSQQTNSSLTMFTAPMATGTYIITAATGSVSGTSSIIVRSPVNINVASANTYVRRGDVLTVDVAIENVVDLTAAKVVLSFDKTMLRAGTVSKGGFFNHDNTVTLLSNSNYNTIGSVELSGARFVNVGSLGVTGSGTLYSVSFTAIVDDPRGTITITEAALNDANQAVIVPKTISPLNIRYRFLGDFGTNTAQGYAHTPDGEIDYVDLMLFTSYWNNHDMRGDIASTRTAGIAPYFTPEPDGQVGFNDLTYFSAMWHWDHTRGTSSFAPLLAMRTGIPVPTTDPTVRMESALKQDEVCVDIVVENVTNLLSGHFIVVYDADRLEVGSVSSPYNSFRKDEAGMLDLSIYGLGNLLQSGTITQIIFKKKAASNGMPAVIYLRTVDLRLYQNGTVVPVSSPQIKQLLLPSDLNGAFCYPNPFVSGKGEQKITFDSLTQNARLRVYTIAGELVYDSGMQDTTDYNRKLPWFVKNDSHENVASGVYLYLITNPAGQTKTGKVGVVR